MVKRLNHSHYVVFGLVLLVLVMGVITSVYGLNINPDVADDLSRLNSGQRIQNDFIGHGLVQVVNAEGVSVDANLNGVIDVAESFQNWPEGQYCLLVHALPGAAMNCPADFDGTRVEAAMDAGALTYDLCCR